MLFRSVVVGIGGDGTLLEAAQIAHASDLPVVGVNLGTVGYLTEFEPDELARLLDTLHELVDENAKLNTQDSMR